MLIAGKKLLIVTQHFWPENFRINDIVDGFLADGIQVDVLCGLPNYPKGEWFDGYSAKGPFSEDYHGAHIYRCKEIPRIGNTSARIFLNYISWPLHAACSLHRLPGNYDAVLCYNTNSVLMSWPAILAARRFRAPLTNYVLDIWPESLYSELPIKNRALRWIAADVSDWLYLHSERLIAPSVGLESRLKKRAGFRNPRRCTHAEKWYTVIPQYCEDFYAQPACDTALKAAGANRFTLMYAGNFSPLQSLDTVLHALAKVKDHVPVHLVLVGDGVLRSELEYLTKELGLQEHVTFYGSVQPAEVPALAGAADALLVPLSDSLDLDMTVPAKLSSCMAARKPLLVSMNGEGAVVAAESGGALVSPACDVDALAQNLERLATLSAADLAAMGDCSFEYYKMHYQRSVLLRQLEEFIFKS